MAKWQEGDMGVGEFDTVSHASLGTAYDGEGNMSVAIMFEGDGQDYSFSFDVADAKLLAVSLLELVSRIEAGDIT